MSDPRSRLFAAMALAVVLLHVPVLICPTLSYDDYDILMRSWTWDETRASLWVTQNEHTMPLGRLTTWAIIQASPDPRYLAYLCDLQGILAVLLALPLIALFVQRELDSPLAGVLAAILFGVTSVYQQAVTWFASSFSVLALDTFLLALLAAQAWRRTGRALYLDATFLCCCLAPGWFASGILAGPLCFVYLLWPDRERPRFARASIAPLVGTVLFLALALPQVAQKILHLEHYEGKTAIDAFNPLVGLGYTCRSLIDNLVLGQLGITWVCVPVWLVAILLPVLLVLLVRWVAPAHQWRLVALAAATILASYLLTYSARSRWDYVKDEFYSHSWNRYHLFPQLGLALLVAVGVQGWLKLSPDAVTPAQGRALLILLVCLTVVQLPRGIGAPPKVWWEEWPAEQWAGFRRLAEVQARCRQHGISRAAALAALPPWLDLPRGGDNFNAWQLLHGSSAPRDVSPEEVRRLLLDQEPPRVGVLPQAHAHNDYQHKRPLLDALDRGFSNIEADVWLWEGKLLVGHWPWDLNGERTLEKLYLEPLRDRAKAPGVPPVTLLVDVKTDARETYAALDKVLTLYADILSVTRNGMSEPKAVTVVLSGNVDRATLAAQAVRYAAIDGRPDDLDSTAPTHLIPWLSAAWDGRFRWQGEGTMPEDERGRLRAFVSQAHERGRMVRFWGTADKPAMWAELRAAGVDLIGTDDLDALRRFLQP
jgi:hypothetical protein